MINKQLIDKISKKFKYSKKAAETAIKEFLNFNSVLDYEHKIALLEICSSNLIFIHRLRHIEDLFEKAFQNDLLSKVSDLIMNDPTLYVISNSHLYDYIHRLKEFGYEEIGPTDKLRMPSLIYDYYFYDDFLLDLKTEDICVSSPISIKQIIVSNLISNTFKNKGDLLLTVGDEEHPMAKKSKNLLKHSKERLDFLNSLIIKVGKHALNLNCVTEAMKKQSKHPEEHKKLCNNIIKIIRANYINPKTHSRDRNWLIFILISLFVKRKGISKNQAILKVTNLLSKDYKELQFPSVNTRFFEDQKFATKHKLSIKEIILKYDLQILVNQYSDKLGIGVYS